MLPVPRLAIIGSGNLAWHLAQVLGPERAVVISRQPVEVGAWPVPILSYPQLREHDWEAVCLAVPDNVITSVAARLADLVSHDTLVFHSSGASPINLLGKHFVQRGVLWPIRSLRKGEQVGDWYDLPLVYDGTTDAMIAYLQRLATSLSKTVHYLDDDQRARLHLAAVFSNNFVTALYQVAYQICHEHDIPFELLLPIIRHTAGSQDGSRPALRQTGAAARGDTRTMERHLSLLKRPAYRKLYGDISDLILQYRFAEHDADLGADADDDFEDKGIA